ncbi:MAG: alpha/beta fold hydrolase [Massilia sp.]
MKRTLLLALALAAGVPGYGADAPQPPNRFAATIVPAERFEVGAMLVERHGQRGRPLVLIPGLGSGSWVWQDMVRELSAEHVVYVVTLPGFDGRPAVAGNTIDAARSALAQLLSSRRLDKPVVVGHSLGGALALALAEDHPDLVGGVVTLDGLPVFPRTEQVPPEQRRQMADGMKAMVPAGPAFEAQQQQYMRGTGVLDMGKADDLARLSSRSDPAAVAQYMADLVALDLRPGLGKIKAPVLLVSPYYEPDMSQFGMTAQAKAEYYKGLMAGTPKLEVVTLAPARHFVMFDQPRQLADTIRRFVKSL